MNQSGHIADEQESMQQGLKVFGDTWTLAIIGVLSEAERRFNELQRNLDNISPTTLTNRLKKLEQLGLIAQQKQTVDQLSVLYVLTEKGKNMLPVLRAIETFSKKFL
ncbi:MAG TPA: helix-turn-helix domain-containing protein [Candidatus Saccharimonadales bacterium]|jgi:DNA-binding HxlR family transcriptional regulator|nr:helix-turn-helix domain-containing protein [Candidatus Saccharimonadales bacterium]